MKINARHFSLLLLLFVWLIPYKGWSQKKQLTPSGKVTKIALIDHARLRKEYKQMATAKAKMFRESESLRKTGAVSEKQKADQKKRVSERTALMNQYENKIRIAIDSVVIAGGFTEIRPFDKKDTTKQRAINITDLVLKKLN